MNFSIAAARSWYAQHQAHYLQAGVDFWWNDEGETQYFTYHLWNRAHQQALTASATPNRRLFTLNRAYTPGMGRDFSVGIWTGDISVSWQAFQRTPATVLRWGLAGAFFVACDTGGFEGGATPPELLARWYQLSATLPIMRVHSRVQNPPHWPWLYGQAAELAMREALALRYRLLPFVYSLAHLSREQGVPLARPLVMEFPHDPQAAHVSDQYMLGASLLCAPVLEEQATSRHVLLPRLLPSPMGMASTGSDGGGDDWFVFNESDTQSKPPLAGGQNHTVQGLKLTTMPLYVRMGSILPLAPTGTQWVTQGPSVGALELQIYAGADASFTLVEDDGVTMDYASGSNSSVRHTELRWIESDSTLSWHVTGDFSGYKSFRAVLFRPNIAQRVQSSVVAIEKGGTLHLPKLA